MRMRIAAWCVLCVALWIWLSRRAGARRAGEPVAFATATAEWDGFYDAWEST